MESLHEFLERWMPGQRSFAKCGLVTWTAVVLAISLTACGGASGNPQVKEAIAKCESSGSDTYSQTLCGCVITRYAARGGDLRPLLFNVNTYRGLREANRWEATTSAAVKHGDAAIARSVEGPCTRKASNALLNSTESIGGNTSTNGGGTTLQAPSPPPTLLQMGS